MPISVEKTVFDTLNQRLDVFQQKQKAAPVVDLSTTKRQHYKPITYQSYFDSIARWSTGLVERFEQRTFIPTAAQSYANAQYDSRTLQGDEVIRNTRRDFLACSPPPTSVQKRMFETYLQVKAPRIYGAEWESDKCAILKRNAWREYDGILLTLTGRKEGKSTGLAQNCLSTVLNVPNWRIAVFSRTREQAQIILLLVIHMFRKHPRAAEFKATFSKREFTISTATDTRTITAYSGDANVSVVCCLFFVFGQSPPHTTVRTLLEDVLLLLLLLFEFAFVCRFLEELKIGLFKVITSGQHLQVGGCLSDRFN